MPIYVEVYDADGRRVLAEFVHPAAWPDRRREIKVPPGGGCKVWRGAAGPVELADVR